MTEEQKLVFQNAVAANGGNITAYIRSRYGLDAKSKHASPSADETPLAEIPSDWREQNWMVKQKLAKAIEPGFEPDPNDRVSSIEAAIEAELARRAEQGAQE